MRNKQENYNAENNKVNYFRVNSQQHLLAANDYNILAHINNPSH